MKAKLKYQLMEGINASLTIDLTVPAAVAMAAEVKGIGKEELDNLCGQAMQTILSLMGNSDEA